VIVSILTKLQVSNILMRSCPTLRLDKKKRRRFQFY